MQASSDLVPFNDLSRTSPETMILVESAIARVLASGWFVMGPEHDAFEAELAEYLGVRNVVAVANGTDALELALAALGVGQHDQVLTVANAGGYATVAARILGAEAVYADVSPSSMLLTAETLTAALSRLDGPPKVLVVTHLYGAMVDMDAVLPIAREHGIAVLEDCAQSLGATHGGHKAGTFGDIATTSFYPTKNLGALGDGGAVFSNDADLATSVRRMRQYGWESKYAIGFDHGRNSRLDELQAAILRVKLPLLDSWNARRREVHARYERATSRAVGRESPSFIAHLAVITANDRDNARRMMREAGIATDVHYPIADHRQNFPVRPPRPVDLPATVRAIETIYSVPMFPELTDAEVERVCATLAILNDSDV